MQPPREPRPSERVRLNVGGCRFETTAGTLTANGKLKTFFSSLLTHHPDDAELFIDRDGDCFGPLLSFLRTGVLHIPPSVSECALRREADYYCIPLPPSQPVRQSGVRSDGLYLSFSARAPCSTASGPVPEVRGPSSTSDGEVRAYLHFKCTEPRTSGPATLGRREADGQWSALQCRYICYPGGLLQVHRLSGATAHDQLRTEDESRDGGGSESSGGSSDGGVTDATCGVIELSAVVMDGEFIEVMQCGRVGRLEQPFHFVPSLPPPPGTAFVSKVGGPVPNQASRFGTGPGRVVLSFESTDVVGVMVTSSHPGWSSVAGCSFRVLQGRRGGGGESFHSETVDEGTPPTDNLCHLEIRNANFSRSTDFVSLGERGLVEFVQLNAQHQPQLIWYRPVIKFESPWR